MKPFVILALPRTGSRMVTRSLSTHSQIPDVTHEFKGDEKGFRDHPYISSNFLRDFMRGSTFIHLYRRDYEAGARSLLSMGFPFSVNLPDHEVQLLVEERKRMDDEFRKVSELSVAYEDLTDGEEINQLPQWFVDRFCEIVGVGSEPVFVEQKKDRQYKNVISDILMCETINDPVSFTVEPKGSQAIILIDRKSLEHLPDEPVCRFDADCDDHHLGGCAWNGGRADFSAIRPGRVSFWSWYMFAAGEKQFTVTLTPYIPHEIDIRMGFQ